MSLSQTRKASGTVLINITEEMQTEAKQLQNIDTGEDFRRTSEERAYHRYVGQIGELAFRKYLDKNSWDHIHMGGPAQPDFLINTESGDQVAVDVKNRANKEKIHQDLIIKQDFAQDYYILMHSHWCSGEIQAVELVGFASHDLVKQFGEEMNIWNSENNRPKLMLEMEYVRDLAEFPYIPKFKTYRKHEVLAASD